MKFFGLKRYSVFKLALVCQKSIKVVNFNWTGHYHIFEQRFFYKAEEVFLKNLIFSKCKWNFEDRVSTNGFIFYKFRFKIFIISILNLKFWFTTFNRVIIFYRKVVKCRHFECSLSEKVVLNGLLSPGETGWLWKVWKILLICFANDFF